MRSSFPRNVEIDHTPPAAESLLLTGISSHWWVSMLGAYLEREEHQLLGTDSFSVYINYEFHAYMHKVAETKVSYLDL